MGGRQSFNILNKNIYYSVLNLPIQIITQMIVMLYVVCEFKNNDYYYIILLGTSQRALGLSGCQLTRPWSSWASLRATWVLSGATHCTLGPLERHPTSPWSFRVLLRAPLVIDCYECRPTPMKRRPPQKQAAVDADKEQLM